LRIWLTPHLPKKGGRRMVPSWVPLLGIDPCNLLTPASNLPMLPSVAACPCRLAESHRMETSAQWSRNEPRYSVLSSPWSHGQQSSYPFRSMCWWKPVASSNLCLYQGVAACQRAILGWKSPKYFRRSHLFASCFLSPARGSTRWHRHRANPMVLLFKKYRWASHCYGTH